MSKLQKLTEYQAITDFKSVALNTYYANGQIFKAPASIGSDLVRKKVAIKITKTKHSEP